MNEDIYVELRKNVKEFVQREVEPISHKMDDEDYFPEDVFRKMGEMGYLGITIPDESFGTYSSFCSFEPFLYRLSSVRLL